MERKGDWMQTASGGVFWPLDPRASEVKIEDIAHALSNMCRYAGHVSEFYSVAQHSVLVSRSLPPEYRLWGLLHDAAEAYVVDVPRPIKRFLTNYAEIEAGVMRVVVEAFGLTPIEQPEAVTVADNSILGDEKKYLMSNTPKNWNLQFPPLGIVIRPWTPAVSRSMFLREFEQLTSKVVTKR